MSLINPGCNSDFMTGYRVEIYPTEDQKRKIWKNIHASRAVYNIGLNLENKNYEINGCRLKYRKLKNILMEMRRSDPKYAWLKEISTGTIADVLRNLDFSFENFFNGKARYPKFKSRRTLKKSYPCRSDRTHIDGDMIRVSGLSGSSHKRDRIFASNHGIPDDRRLWRTTISTDGYGRYWFSCNIEDPSIMIDMSDVPQTEPVGIDMGIVNLITTSDRKFFKYSNVDWLVRRQKRLDRRLERDFRKYHREAIRTKTKYEDVPKSKNHRKRLLARFKITQRIKNIYRNDVHTATKRVVDQNPAAIVIEDILVRKQMSDHKGWITKYAPQMRYYETRRQLEYKAYRRGIPIIVADKQYPSSKRCSCCGEFGTLLKGRRFKCRNCGYEEDRDINAAYNLQQLAFQ